MVIWLFNCLIFRIMWTQIFKQMKAFGIKRKSFALLLFFSFSILYLQAQQHPYIDVSKSLGIDHTYILNNSGGGVSFVDFNQDGLDDITLATGKDEQIHFYENTGSGFELVDLGIDNSEQAKTVLWADIDNDGDQDFYVTAFAGTNHLYENDGNMTFEQITESAGLPIDTLKCFGAIWGDYNRDGYLDLYYTERPNANSGTTQRNRLFKNLGQNTFEEVTYITNASDEGRLPFCAAFFDYNNDKWPDIYIANDRKKRNTLLQNNQGVFEDVSDECNAGIEIDAMNVAIGDVDNNGLNDIYVTNTPSGSALLKCNIEENTEQIVFEDEAGDRGVGFYGIGWGANFLDADNDGWQDLYVSGMLIGSDVISSELYLNDQTGFFDQASKGFVGDTVTSFVNAIGDFNDDGYPDIMVNNSQYYDSQLWTALPGDNNWIKINLQGVTSNRDGIGAKIEVSSDELAQMKYTHCGIAFMGQNSNSQLFGLGSYEMIDSIKITWPTGHIDRLYDIESNQKITIVEGQTTNGIINIDQDILSNVKIQDKFSDILLTPNPSSNLIYLSGLNIRQKINFKIVDSFGKIHAKGILKDDSIDISNIGIGMYFLQLIDETNNVGSLKFVKI